MADLSPRTTNYPSVDLEVHASSVLHLFPIYTWGYIPYTTGWTVPMRQLHALYAELWNNQFLKLFQLVYSYVLMVYQWRPMASCTWGKKNVIGDSHGYESTSTPPYFRPGPVERSKKLFGKASSHFIIIEVVNEPGHGTMGWPMLWGKSRDWW